MWLPEWRSPRPNPVQHGPSSIRPQGAVDNPPLRAAASNRENPPPDSPSRGLSGQLTTSAPAAIPGPPRTARYPSAPAGGPSASPGETGPPGPDRERGQPASRKPSTNEPTRTSRFEWESHRVEEKRCRRTESIDGEGGAFSPGIVSLIGHKLRRCCVSESSNTCDMPPRHPFAAVWPECATPFPAPVSGKCVKFLSGKTG